MKRIALMLLALALFTIAGAGFVVKGAEETGTAKNALIVIDPGFSKFSVKIGEQIAQKMTQKGYTVKQIPATEFKTQDTSTINVLVIGGPTYASQPGAGLKKVILAIPNNPPYRILLYITGVLKDESGLDTCSKLLAEKGLPITGKSKFLASDKETAYNEQKIDRLLEVLRS